jgi:prepilin-type N-terminal cleavage/methylation domain-containing protein
VTVAIRFGRGFTLLEILLVVAIVGLLVAIMFPLVGRAKRSARQSTCAQQLRQMGMALAMYEEEFGSNPPSIEALSDAGILKSTALALCPDDPVGGYGSKWDLCHKVAHPYPQSYETIFQWYPYQLERLERADANHGVMVCRLHGDRTDRYRQAAKLFCEYAWFMFEGPLLRLRKDGSLQTAKLRFKRVQKGPGLYEETVGRWQLFTDEKEVREKHGPPSDPGP